MCLTCLDCVLKHGLDPSIDNVAYPALKEDKLLSLLKPQQSLVAAEPPQKVQLIEAQTFHFFLLFFQHQNRQNENRVYKRCV